VTRSSALRELMATRTRFSGAATALLTELNAVVTHKDKSWPESPRRLGGKFRRARTTLRKIGIEIEFDREQDRKRDRVITIDWNSASTELP
jgi:hypothetical protein